MCNCFKEIGRKDIDIERGSDGSCEDECSSEDVHVMDIEDKPDQPDPKYIEVQTVK